MAPGEKLFRFPAGPMLQRLHRTATIRVEDGNLTHVTADTERTWRYSDLPSTLEPGPVAGPKESRCHSAR